ncbi:MAG: hypothetical protein JWN23_3044 [Rhodocyclales bacterium]|nr:hypothetical protein [Rhodocyclales bacterium]
MKTLLIIASILGLSACASSPQISSVVNGYRYTTGPSDANDPRLRSPAFYMDDDKPPYEYVGPGRPFWPGAK